MIGAPTARPVLPTGTVTFLRTDVEGSMGLANALGARWDAVNATHLDLIGTAVEAHGGVRVRTEGDALFAVFPEAGAAVLAATEAQRALAGHPWPEDAPVRVRMGLHSGEAYLAGEDYGGFEVNRVARIAAAGHGGQIVLSEPTRLLAERAIPEGVSVRDLGRHVLRDVPSPERLFQLDVPGLRVAFPPLRTARPAAGNLPMRMTSFLGRDEDLAELGALLESNRLVTLTGPGGVGKTSLAVELGRTWEGRVPDGVWFVALDAISEPAMVRAEIARSLGLFDGPDRPAALGLDHYLADRSMVFVIDNFEHVLDAAAEVTAILRVSPGTRIVVTSRAPLHVSGEQEYPVRSLADAEASRDLFVQRARAVRPSWDPGSDRGVVDEICTMLDGLPLGLELAAARVSLLPLSAIRDRLAARLPLPGSGPRDVPHRQRTLESAISWSHDLMDEAQRRLLHALAVFEGSFDVEQAAHVGGGDVLDGLATLAEHSLVSGLGDTAGGGIRYRMLRTIRSFGLDRLIADGREADVRRAHALAYHDFTTRAAVYLPGADQAVWLDRLAPDQANIRAATRWAIDAGEVDLALGLVAHAWRFWQLAGHLAEGSELTEAALSMPGADSPTAARLGALVAAGGIAYWRADMDAARARYQEQLGLALRLGDRVAEADAHFNLMFANNLHLSTEAAALELQAALSLFEELNDEQGIARTTWARATLLMGGGKREEALLVFHEAVAAFERIGDSWYYAMGTGSLSWTYFDLDQPRKATRWAVRTLVRYHALRDTTTATISLAMCARIALECGRPEEAAVLLGAFENLCEVYGVRPPVGILHVITGANIEQRTHEVMDPEEFAQATERGRRLTLDEAVAVVVEIGEAIDPDGVTAQ